MSNHCQEKQLSIHAEVVKQHDRMYFLPRHLNTTFIEFEHYLYHFADKLVEGYDGGYWDLYDIDNGGFFAGLSEDKTFKVSSLNGYSCELSGKYTGLFLTMMALSLLFEKYEEKESVLSKLVEKYYFNRDYISALDREICGKLFNLLD